MVNSFNREMLAELSKAPLPAEPPIGEKVKVGAEPVVMPEHDGSAPRQIEATQMGLQPLRQHAQPLLYLFHASKVLQPFHTCHPTI